MSPRCASWGWSGATAPRRGNCPFCAAPQKSDADGLIVYRGVTSYALLNLFPYNSGHLLVCPYRHVATYDQATEEEVAEALGDPARLARELRAETGLKRWEEERNPTSAAGAIFAVLGLGAIDILILLPILMTVAGTLFGLIVAAIAIFVGGGVVFAAGPFLDPPGGAAVALLGGIGLMAAAASLGAILTLCVIGLVNALVWYGRLHYRLLKPAMEPKS